MKVYTLPIEMVNALRSWFHPKDRSIYLSDELWIISKRLAWETAISKFQMLPGLVGFWPMSSVQRSTGNAYDLSGQGRTLTYNGNPTYNIHNSLVPYIHLDGTGDYLSRADETDLDILGSETIYAPANRGLSLGAWVRFTNAPSVNEHIISKYIGGAGAQSYRLLRNSGGELNLQLSADGTAVFSLLSTGIIGRNAWTFVAATFSPGSSANAYIGSSSGWEKTSTTTSIPTGLFNSPQSLTLGARSDGAVFMTGDICLAFLSANFLEEAALQALFEQSRKLMGV